MKSVKVGQITIPVDNIDYVNVGDGTEYGRPYVILKSGKRINLEWGDVDKIEKAMQDE